MDKPSVMEGMRSRHEPFSRIEIWNPEACRWEMGATCFHPANAAIDAKLLADNGKASRVVTWTPAVDYVIVPPEVVSPRPA